MIFQKKGSEEVKIIVRRHWAALISLIGFVIVMLTLPVVLFFLLRAYLDLSAGALNLFIIGSSIYYMFVANMLFIGWLDYYLDAAIITNERIIDIDQHGLFNRTISELHFSKIQDATGSCKGILQNVLDFGNVHIQTAGAAREFDLDQVPKPYKISKLIIDLQHQAIREERKNYTNNNKSKDGT